MVPSLVNSQMWWAVDEMVFVLDQKGEAETESDRPDKLTIGMV